LDPNLDQVASSLSKLNVFAHMGDHLKENRLRRGVSLPNVKESASADQRGLNPQSSAQELVSSHSERSTLDEFRRRAPSSSHTGIQPEFITVRATSPSYSTRASTPNMNPITEMDLRNDRNSHSIENGMNGMNGNHALEIEMDNQSMDDLDPMDNAASSSGPKRTMTDPQDVHIAVKEDDQIDKRPTV